MNCSSDANTQWIHRWTPLDRRQGGWRVVLGPLGEPDTPNPGWRVCTGGCTQWRQGSGHRVMNAQVRAPDYSTFSKMDFLQNAQESLLLWKICRWADEPERPLAIILVCLVTGSWRDSQQDCCIEKHPLAGWREMRGQETGVKKRKKETGVT